MSEEKRVYTEVNFPEEDRNWLHREAERRKITVHDLTMEIVGEFEFTIPRGGWSEEQVKAHFQQRILSAVRKARLGHIAWSN